MNRNLKVGKLGLRFWGFEGKLAKMRLRAGLKKLARKGAGAWPAWRGGDFRSHRKPAGPAFRPPRTSSESPKPAPKKSQFYPATAKYRPIVFQHNKNITA